MNFNSGHIPASYPTLKHKSAIHPPFILANTIKYWNDSLYFLRFWKFLTRLKKVLARIFFSKIRHLQSKTIEITRFRHILTFCKIFSNLLLPFCTYHFFWLSVLDFQVKYTWKPRKKRALGLTNYPQLILLKIFLKLCSSKFFWFEKNEIFTER